MSFWNLLIATAVALSAAECGLTSEDKLSVSNSRCECMLKAICATEDIRTNTDSCNKASEVCCAKIPSVVPISHTSTKNAFKRCGYQQTPGSSSQITNGAFPWMVKIAELGDGGNNGRSGGNSTITYQCGGSLIHPSVILTGAHCVYGKDPSQLQVITGELSPQISKEPSFNGSNQVIKIVTHEDYDNHSLRNDVALLFLREPIHSDDSFGFTCIPLKGILPDPKTKCFAIIWKRESTGEILNREDWSITEHGVCQNALRKTKLGNKFILHSSFMCADSKDNVDLTKDNGGSPLMCPLPDNPEIYIQSGLLARVVESKEYDAPAVFVNVANFRTWIDTNMQENHKDTSYYAY